MNRGGQAQLTGIAESGDATKSWSITGFAGSDCIVLESVGHEQIDSFDLVVGVVLGRLLLVS